MTDDELTTRDAIRVEQVITVWLNVLAGMTVKDALKDADMSERTYYRWLPKAKETKEILDQAKQEMELLAYHDIVATKNRVLVQLLTDGLAPLTEPKDRLAILQYLDGRSDLLRERNRPESEIPDFLDGPNLEPAESRILGGGVFDLTVNKEGDEITIKQKPPQVIDITPEEN
jgi:hypothetical protein